MAKRNTILQKKLKELESILNQALSLPLETASHQSFSQDIQQRFLFLNNLLSAEVSSGPRNPFHLQHIAKRVLELEAAFKEWDSFQSSALDHVEKGSACSCTESCLNDDDDDGETVAEEGSTDHQLISLSDLEQAAEASTELSLAKAGLDFEGFKEQDRKVEHGEKHEMSESEEEEEEKVWVEAKKRIMIREEEEEEEEEEERNGAWLGECWAALGSGILIGMILMAVFMVRFSGCFHCYEDTDYTHSLRPT